MPAWRSLRSLVARRPPSAFDSRTPAKKPRSLRRTTRPAGQPARAASPHVPARDDGERRLVAREGLEPSKPLGRQIYSLLRLTASLPRQLPVCLLETRCCPEC